MSYHFSLCVNLSLYHNLLIQCLTRQFCPDFVFPFNRHTHTHSPLPLFLCVCELPGALVQCKGLAGLNVCIHVLLAVKYIIPQTRSVPLISDSASGKRAQTCAHTCTHIQKTHTHMHLSAYTHIHRRTHTHTNAHRKAVSFSWHWNQMAGWTQKLQAGWNSVLSKQ